MTSRQEEIMKKMREGRGAKGGSVAPVPPYGAGDMAPVPPYGGDIVNLPYYGAGFKPYKKSKADEIIQDLSKRIIDL